MEIDERHCPTCGHDVLSWDITCPGCSQVPWDSPAGRRIFSARQRREFLVTKGPWLLGALVLLGIIIVANLHLTRFVDMSRQPQELQQSLEDALELEQELVRLAHDASAYAQVASDAQGWIARTLPQWFAIAEDAQQPARVRAQALMNVGHLYGEFEHLKALAEGQQIHVVRALKSLLAHEQNEELRSVVALTLGQVGNAEAVKAFEDWWRHANAKPPQHKPR